MTGLQNCRDPRYADFNWRQFAFDLVRHLAASRLSQRAAAAAAGVALNDIQRAAHGRMISTGRVIAICEQLLCVDVHAYYCPPMIAADGFTCDNGKDDHHEQRPQFGADTG